MTIPFVCGGYTEVSHPPLTHRHRLFASVRLSTFAEQLGLKLGCYGR